MIDEQIIQLYFDRDERAIQETDKKYGRYCFTVANAILNNREDSQEAVSDAWLRAWNSIPPQHPSKLKLYLAKITRNLAFSVYRGKNAAKRGSGELELALEELDACIPASGSLEDGLEAEDLAAVIRAFLRTLPVRDQNVFIRRYFFVEKTNETAMRYGLTESNVLKILSRTRKKLKQYLTQEGYGI